MSVFGLLLKPFVNKAKKDLSDLVRGYIEARKNADEDGNGEADFLQLQRDAGDILAGCRLIAGGCTRIFALLMCYYLKYNPKQKLEALNAVASTTQKVALLTQSSGDVA